jgi:hypothetical protein
MLGGILELIFILYWLTILLRKAIRASILNILMILYESNKNYCCSCCEPDLIFLDLSNHNSLNFIIFFK